MAQYVSTSHILDGFNAASWNLSNNIDLLNALNVFPVADKDTGINMANSLKNTVNSLDRSLSPGNLFKQASSILLTCAHGNSGTILTLFFQGLGNNLPASGNLNGVHLANAFYEGALAAEKGIPDPMSGTILTVATKAASAGIASVNSGITSAETIWERITEEAFSVLPLTSIQNPILSKYNVMDSGALGFCMILDGFLAAICENSFKLHKYQGIKLPDFSKGTNKVTVPANRFCTEIVITPKSTTLCSESIREELTALGDCLLVVQNNEHLKAHIHTNHPDKVIEILQKNGTIESKKLDDMLQECLNHKEAPKEVDIILCSDSEMTELYKTMDFSLSFCVEDNIDEIKNIIIGMSKQESVKYRLLSSVPLPDALEKNFNNILLFESDEKLTEYILSI